MRFNWTFYSGLKSTKEQQQQQKPSIYETVVLFPKTANAEHPSMDTQSRGKKLKDLGRLTLPGKWKGRDGRRYNLQTGSCNSHILGFPTVPVCHPKIVCKCHVWCWKLNLGTCWPGHYSKGLVICWTHIIRKPFGLSYWKIHVGNVSRE